MTPEANFHPAANSLALYKTTFETVSRKLGVKSYRLSVDDNPVISQRRKTSFECVLIQVEKTAF